MQKRFEVENFKCFSKNISIDLGDINVCLGCNSVGKSSIVQSLILVRQIYEHLLETKEGEIIIQLNGVYGLQLGDAEHIKSSKERSDIVIRLDDQEFKLRSIEGSPFEMSTLPVDVEALSKQEGIFSPNFYYLNAERVGPRTYHSISTKQIKNCGAFGENTAHYFNLVSNNKVEEKRCFQFDENKNVPTVSKQVEYWMDYLIPGISIKADDLTDLRLSRMQYRQVTLDTEFLSPYSFGFGISYVLPIIVTGLTAQKGSAFIVENPEVHLHPKGQSHIGFFLAMVAFSGVQVIVETHSEHVLNGIRIAALKERKAPSDLSINFFSIDEEDGNIVHRVEPIKLSDRMDFRNWPSGFMDQEEEDLKTLRSLRK